MRTTARPPYTINEMMFHHGQVREVFDKTYEEYLEEIQEGL